MCRDHASQKTAIKAGFQPPSHQMPRSIIVNTCYGGFGLSEQAKTMYLELTKEVERSEDFFVDQDVSRDDPALVRVVTELGIKASSGLHAKLGIVHIPDDVPSDGWIIQEFDGFEFVAEKHRTWRAEPEDGEIVAEREDGEIVAEREDGEIVAEREDGEIISEAAEMADSSEHVPISGQESSPSHVPVSDADIIPEPVSTPILEE